MQDKNYILLYANKKIEDTLCIRNMFENNKEIHIGWTTTDNTNNMKIIDQYIQNGTKQLIFLGIEIGLKELILNLKSIYDNIKIKVSCTTMDSLLYYEYERNNFLDMLELSKKGYIDQIAFLRKGQFEMYSKLGYKCVYLLENYIEHNKLVREEKINEEMNIGIYQLNYTWDKNVFNQLCVGKFISDSIVNYNLLDNRMSEFLETMNIKSNGVKIEPISVENVKKELVKNTINISCSFTEYMHPIFFISMENDIPCITGFTMDNLEDDRYLEKLICKSEDNPIKIAERIYDVIKSKEQIMKSYKKWKEEYNKKSKRSMIEFLSK